jgi:hypothetical protein
LFASLLFYSWSSYSSLSLSLSLDCKGELAGARRLDVADGEMRVNIDTTRDATHPFFFRTAAANVLAFLSLHCLPTDTPPHPTLSQHHKNKKKKKKIDKQGMLFGRNVFMCCISL